MSVQESIFTLFLSLMTCSICFKMSSMRSWYILESFLNIVHFSSRTSFSSKYWKSNRILYYINNITHPPTIIPSPLSTRNQTEYYTFPHNHSKLVFQFKGSLVYILKHLQFTSQYHIFCDFSIKKCIIYIYDRHNNNIILY